MKAIVSGGNGFVGSKLIKNLESNGYSVTNIVSRHSLINTEDAKEILFSEIDSLKEEFDIFFHFAWRGTSGNMRADENTQLENVLNTCKYIRKAAELGCKKFVYAGSIMEYELKEKLKDDVRYPNMMYGLAKGTARDFGSIIADMLGINFITVTISNVYGPNEKSERFVNLVLNKMIKNEKIELTDCKQEYDFIYIDDAVEAIRLVGEKGINNTNYYIGNKESRELKDYVEIMKRMTKTNSIIEYGAIKKSGKDFSYNLIRMSRIYEELHFNIQTSFEMGIDTMIKQIKGYNEMMEV